MYLLKDDIYDRCSIATACINCGTIFLHLTDKQLDLVKYIKENKQLEIVATEKRYYPTNKDWENVKKCKEQHILINLIQNFIVYVTINMPI